MIGIIRKLRLFLPFLLVIRDELHVQVLECPVHRYQFLPDWRQGILHPWRDLCIHHSRDDAVLFQLPKLTREHLQGDPRDLLLKFVITKHAILEEIQDPQLPFPSMMLRATSTGHSFSPSRVFFFIGYLLVRIEVNCSFFLEISEERRRYPHMNKPDHQSTVCSADSHAAAGEYWISAPRFDRRILLGILVVGAFMANFDVVMVNVALPTITESFQTNLALSQWTVTGYILAMTSLLIICAKISEDTGISLLYKIGFFLFTFSSLGCGLSATPGQRILSRMIQGTGASMIYCGMGPLILHASLPEERGRAMGYVTTAVEAATLLGPFFGGVVTDHLGWQYIFFINIPVGIVVFAFSRRYMQLQERHLNWTYQKIDWMGAVMLVTAVVSVLLLCRGIASGLMVTVPVIVCAAVSLLVIPAFISHESRITYPLIDLTIFRNIPFAKATVCLLLFFTALNLTNIVGRFP